MSDLLACVTCKRQIALVADSCPQCGAKDPFGFREVTTLLNCGFLSKDGRYYPHKNSGDDWMLPGLCAMTVGGGIGYLFSSFIVGVVITIIVGWFWYSKIFSKEKQNERQLSNLKQHLLQHYGLSENDLMQLHSRWLALRKG